MKVTQESLPASQVQLEIEVPADVSGQVYESTLRQVAQQVQIPGFRKGKVPRKILVQKMGQAHLKAKALEELLDKAVKDATKAEKIPVLGNYSFAETFDEMVANYNPGQPLTFTVTADVFPELKVKQYTDLTIQAVEVFYDPAQMDTAIENQRKQMSTLVPVEDRAAEMGDVATVDFTGRYQEPAEGEAPEIPNASATDMQVELADGRMIPGFVEGIVGMKPGETKTVAATFPDAYADATLAGRAAEFEITLYELKIRELPPLDDEFAKNLQYESLDDLREKLTDRYQKEAKTASETNRNEAIIRALAEQMEVEFPVTLIDQESKRLVNQMFNQLKQSGQNINQLMSDELIGHLLREARPQAIESLKQTLAVQEVARVEKMTVDSARVNQEVATIIATVKDPKKVNMANLKEVVELDLLQQQVMEWCAAHNTIEWITQEEAAALAAAAKDLAEGTVAVEAETVDAEAVDAETVAAEAVEAETVDAEAVDAETVAAEDA